MESYTNRVDSFSKPKRVRPQGGKPSSAVNVKWTHSSAFTATPETLAEAGFHYSPTFTERDNVTCFMCNKELDDWGEDDDPFDIHWVKCKSTCPWAIVRCGLKFDMADDGQWVFSKTRKPTSKSMEKARLQTFTKVNSWPHQDKSHGANPKSMAEAGFVFTPQHAGDDLSGCLYCGTALSGWEDADDPWEEHRKRVAKNGKTCPFFPAAPAKSKPKPTKSTTATTKRPQSTAPTRSRATAASTKSSQPVETDDEPETAAAESSSSSKAVPKRQKATKAKPKAAPAKGRSTRSGKETGNGKKNVAPQKGSSSEVEAEAEADFDEDITESTAQARQPPQASSSDEEGDEEEDIPVEVTKSKPVRKSTRASTRATSRTTTQSRTRKATQVDVVAPTPSAAVPSTSKAASGKPTATRSNTKGKGKAQPAAPRDLSPPPDTTDMEVDESEQHHSSEAELEQFTPRVAPLPRASAHLSPPSTPPPDARSATTPPFSEQPSLSEPNSQPDRGDISDGPMDVEDAVVEISDDDDDDADIIADQQMQSPSRGTSNSCSNSCSSLRQSVTKITTIPQPAIVSDTASSTTPAPTIKASSPVHMHLSPERPTESLEREQHSPKTPDKDHPDNGLHPSVVDAQSTFNGIDVLTEAELDMTVEEWIRHEMDIQYNRFKADGERMIKDFQHSADEARRTIESM